METTVTPTAPVFDFDRIEDHFTGRPTSPVVVDGTPAVFVNDPALVRQILVGAHKDFGKGELFQKARNLSRAGLLTDDEAAHRHYRRLAHPLLSNAAATEHAATMRRTVRQTIGTWRSGQAVDVQAQMCTISSTIAIRTLLGTLPEARTRRLAAQLAVLSWEMMKKPLYGTAAALANHRGASSTLVHARKEFRRLIAACVADREPCPRATRGYLAQLLDDDDGARRGPALTEEQICDEAVMMLTAATVTTASVLSWAFHLVSTHPHAERQLLKDAAGSGCPVTDRRRTGGSPDYTLRFLMEVLRLYPPVWITCRRTLREVALGDELLPPGTQVLFSSYLLHRDPAHHRDPDCFDPDRWLTHRPSADDASYIPFGIGAKGCVGEAFAWQELVVILGEVLREWSLDVSPGTRVRPAADTTLHPHRLVMIPRARRRPDSRCA
ncbi:Pentalenene oxygenase [Streptomyces sp. YIM 130001]|uniref:cytochrome P450 n=1 Tax=Streptomyces sp. YIM 130001 TaxID=2259644 RepID=UPI000E64C764|nr:cytochrome P450 [Streptomyces sp. YIM 130001]RII13470.1 Pentalenene oxygenase [Streptomyces sp. YIM 130001]